MASSIIAATVHDRTAGDAAPIMTGSRLVAPAVAVAVVFVAWSAA